VVGIGPRRRRNKYSLFTLIERSFWNSPGYWIALNPHMTRAAHWLGGRPRPAAATGENVMRKKFAIAVVALLAGALMLPNHESVSAGLWRRPNQKIPASGTATTDAAVQQSRPANNPAETRQSGESARLAARVSTGTVTAVSGR